MVMRVVNKYSFKNGLELLEKEKPIELSEVLEAIKWANSEKCVDAGLYFPKALASEILDRLHSKGWTKPKIPFEKPNNFIEGDGLKNEVGLELQFGTYSFIGWDFLGKMALFGKQGIYKFGIEVVPMASLRRKMSKGVGSFEMMAETLEKKGNPNLEIPVVLLGIDG